MYALIFQLRAAFGSLVLSFWHLISFPFSRRSRWRNLRLWDVACDPFVLERISFSALLPDPFVLTVGPLKACSHNTSEVELLCLAAMVKATNAKNVFEIGTFDGRSARAMAMNLPESGRLFTLNLPPGEDFNAVGVKNVDSQLNTKVISGFRFASTPEASKIEQVFGDSAVFDFKPYEGGIDLVFIDGSHEYGYVEKDTQSALRMLKSSGGWILWHDAPLYGVAVYLTEKMRQARWDVRLFEGTTIAAAYVKDGKIDSWPELPLKP